MKHNSTFKTIKVSFDEYNMLDNISSQAGLIDYDVEFGWMEEFIKLATGFIINENSFDAFKQTLIDLGMDSLANQIHSFNNFIIHCNEEFKNIEFTLKENRNGIIDFTNLEFEDNVPMIEFHMIIGKVFDPFSKEAQDHSSDYIGCHLFDSTDKNAIAELLAEKEANKFLEEFNDLKTKHIVFWDFFPLKGTL